MNSDTSMHLALVDGVRTPPSPRLRGACPACGRDMVAKCGEIRLHHWAHSGRRVCDNWWEQETEWHRAWKNRFDLSWQEVIGHDEVSGEKHIADVSTPHGLVIEFQRSHLPPRERSARETFYGNMVWVVDGTRLKTDHPRFLDGMKYARQHEGPEHMTTRFPDASFPSNWLNSRVPVFFDFGTDMLWGLLPGRDEGRAAAVPMPPAAFISAAHTGPEILKETIETLAHARLVREDEEHRGLRPRSFWY